jgi:chemotaxis protein methyltransferase CheR
MKNEDCVAFLQWSLPRLGLRWAGFRKVRKTVCKRVAARMRALGLTDTAAYRAYLEAHPAEWPRLDAMCRIPISRFWRDRAVFDALAQDVLPSLAAAAAARGRKAFRAWSAGAASGEEPYSLRLAWALRAEPAFPGLGLEIVATEIDEILLSRAKAGLYAHGSLKELSPDLLERAFRPSDGLFELREALRRDVTFLRQDIREAMPEGAFDVILCRNLIFTYFDAATQATLMPRLAQRLHPGGALVIGAHEQLPAPAAGFAPWDGPKEIYRTSPS